MPTAEHPPTPPPPRGIVQPNDNEALRRDLAEARQLARALAGTGELGVCYDGSAASHLLNSADLPHWLTCPCSAHDL